MSALSRLGLRRYHIGVAIVGALLLALGWFIPRNHDWDPALWHMNWQQGFFSMLGFGSLFALCLAPALVIAGLAARSSLVFIFSCACGALLLALADGGVGRSLAKAVGVAEFAPVIAAGQCRVPLKSLLVNMAPGQAVTVAAMSCPVDVFDMAPVSYLMLPMEAHPVMEERT